MIGCLSEEVTSPDSLIVISENVGVRPDSLFSHSCQGVNNTVFHPVCEMCFDIKRKETN